MATYVRFGKLEGLSRIQELGLPHPKWSFVAFGERGQDSFGPSLPLKIVSNRELVLSSSKLWTLRTCLVEGTPDMEYGLKRAVGVHVDQLTSRMIEFQKHYDELGLRVVFVVYPYFQASKSGIIEIRHENQIIETVVGEQWRLTEEGAPPEVWRHEGPGVGGSKYAFERKVSDEIPVLTREEVGCLAKFVVILPDDQ